MVLSAIGIGARQRGHAFKRHQSLPGTRRKSCEHKHASTGSVSTRCEPATKENQRALVTCNLGLALLFWPAAGPGNLKHRAPHRGTAKWTGAASVGRHARRVQLQRLPAAAGYAQVCSAAQRGTLLAKDLLTSVRTPFVAQPDCATTDDLLEHAETQSTRKVEKEEVRLRRSCTARLRLPDARGVCYNCKPRVMLTPPPRSMHSPAFAKQQLTLWKLPPTC